MKIYTYFLLLFLCFSNTSQGQRHKRFTYFGIEIGSKSGFTKVTDAGTELYSKSTLQNSHQGVFIEQELDYIWSVSTGVYFSKQKLDFRFRRDGGYNFYEPIRLIQIPFQVRASIPLTYGTPEVRLTPLMGIHFAFNQSNIQTDVKGRITPDLSDYFTGTFRRDLGSLFVLGEGGMNLDMMFAQGAILSFGGSYFKGFKNMMQTDVTYSIAKVLYRGSVVSQGDNFNIRLSVKYPVSRFWRKTSFKRKSKGS